MRARSVALECGTRRSVVGAFDLTPDGDLVLVDCAFCPPTEGRADGVRFDPPGWASRGPIVANPPLHRALLKSVEVPRVAGGQREQVLRFEAGQIAGGALTDAVWSHGPVSAGAPEREIVAVLKVAVGEELCAGVERCGLSVERIVPAGWALVRALRHNYPELAGRAVVVWIDGDSALLLRVERTEVAQRLVGLPGRGRVGERELAPSVAGAAPLRVEASGSPSALGLDRVAVEIARLAEAGATTGAASGEMNVFLGGDDSVGSEAVAMLAARAAVPVIGFDALRRVRLGPRARDVDDATALQMGVAVGLALAAGDAEAIDLLPPARRRENRFRRTRHRWLLATAGLAVALVVPCIWMRQERLELQRENAIEAARLVPQRVAERQQREAESERDRLRQQLADLVAVRAARTGWLEWLADLQERLTQAEDVWLESLAVRTPAPSAAGETEVRRIAVTGCVLHRAGKDPLESVRRLREGLLASRFVAAVEAERFDDSRPGLLRFGCTLVMKPEAAL